MEFSLVRNILIVLIIYLKALRLIKVHLKMTALYFKETFMYYLMKYILNYMFTEKYIENNAFKCCLRTFLWNTLSWGYLKCSQYILVLIHFTTMCFKCIVEGFIKSILIKKNKYYFSRFLNAFSYLHLKNDYSVFQI